MPAVPTDRIGRSRPSLEILNLSSNAEIMVATSQNPANSAAAAFRSRKPKKPSLQQEDLPDLSRPPLLPSEKDNAAACRRPRAKEVTSRYLSCYSSSLSSTTSSSPSSTVTTSTNATSSSSPSSTPSSRRFPSPLLTSRPSLTASKRSQSVDRSRSSNGVSPEISTTKSLCTTRRLSVSFQGESFVFQTSKIQQDSARSTTRNIIISARSGDLSASSDTDTLSFGNSFKSPRTTPSSTNSTAKSLPSLSRMMPSPSIINFAAEILKRGKRGENRVEEAHSLRLLHNRHLQWRHVNARTSSLLSLQNLTAERNLHNAWMSTTQKRDSVVMKKITLHLLRRNMKLGFLLKEQMVYLEEWSLMDGEHGNSLSGTVEALKAAVLRLPVVDGARGSVQDIKNAVGSAVDVMQSTRSSLWLMMSKVDKTSHMATELLKVATQERALLEESQSLLSRLAAMHVELCSLRAHLQQLNRHRG